jgi:hypothetical protein
MSPSLPDLLCPEDYNAGWSAQALGERVTRHFEILMHYEIQISAYKKVKNELV